MALTKVGGGILQNPLNFTGNINAVGVITATGGINAIGIQSAGVVIASGIITALNFVGTGNTVIYNSATKTVDISISGGGGSGIQLYNNSINQDINISLPYKTAAIYADRDLTIDIENGVTITVDNGCYLNIVYI